MPKISHVVEIINPQLQQRLHQYVAKLSWPYNGVEQYYHGTQIKCDMLQYYEPCSQSNCGVCGISKQGFHPQRINRSSWQRFGKGFYFTGRDLEKASTFLRNPTTILVPLMILQTVKLVSTTVCWCVILPLGPSIPSTRTNRQLAAILVDITQSMEAHSGLGVVEEPGYEL